MPGRIAVSSRRTPVRLNQASRQTPSLADQPLNNSSPQVLSTIPAKRKMGGCGRPFPAEGATILRRFGIKYGRYPSGKEADVMVAQVRDKTGYNTTVGTVKYWFYKHRAALNLKTFMDFTRAMRFRGITPLPTQMSQGTITISSSNPARILNYLNSGGQSTSPRHGRIRRQAPTTSPVRPNIGGNRRPYPKETIAIFEEFAVDYGRYPSSVEASDLVERAREDTGYRTTVKSVKFWFYKHRIKFNLKTLADSSRALRFSGATDIQIEELDRREIPNNSITTDVHPPCPTTLKEPSLIISTPASVRSHPHLPTSTILPAPPLSQAQMEVLRALQASSIQQVNDSVLSTCAQSWAVDKRLITEWLRENQSAYRPPTPTSPPAFTPISFSIPLRPNEVVVHGAVPQCAIFLTNTSAQSSSQVARGIEGTDEDDLTDTMLFDQFVHGWSAEPPEIEMTDVETPAGTQLPPMKEPAMDPFMKGLVEALREAIEPPPSPPAKPANAKEFQVSWPAITSIDVLHRTQAP